MFICLQQQFLHLQYLVLSLHYKIYLTRPLITIKEKSLRILISQFGTLNSIKFLNSGNLIPLKAYNYITIKLLIISWRLYVVVIIQCQLYKPLIFAWLNPILFQKWLTIYRSKVGTTNNAKCKQNCAVPYLSNVTFPYFSR